MMSGIDAEWQTLKLISEARGTPATLRRARIKQKGIQKAIIQTPPDANLMYLTFSGRKILLAFDLSSDLLVSAHPLNCTKMLLCCTHYVTSIQGTYMHLDTS